MHISKLGDTYAVVLSEEALKRLGLKEGDEVEVLPAASNPAQRRDERSIDEIFGQIRQLRGLIPADYRFKRSDAYEDGEY